MERKEEKSCIGQGIFLGPEKDKMEGKIEDLVNGAEETGGERDMTIVSKRKRGQPQRGGRAGDDM